MTSVSITLTVLTAVLLMLFAEGVLVDSVVVVDAILVVDSVFDGGVLIAAWYVVVVLNCVVVAGNNYNVDVTIIVVDSVAIEFVVCLCCWCYCCCRCCCSSCC